LITYSRDIRAKLGRELTEDERKNTKEWVTDPSKIEVIVAREATVQSLPVAD
jgi:hypothetical protein